MVLLALLQLISLAQEVDELLRWMVFPRSFARSRGGSDVRFFWCRKRKIDSLSQPSTGQSGSDSSVDRMLQPLP